MGRPLPGAGVLLSGLDCRWSEEEAEGMIESSPGVGFYTLDFADEPPKQLMK